MKEFTIEEKAKRYDEAIEIARKINSGEDIVAPKDWTIPEVIFHELRESEDENIIQNCIYFLKLQKSHHAETSIIDECIAWLEKQGNQKVTVDFKAKDWYVSKVDGKIHNIYGSGKSALEAIEEEKVDNANKVEPKFKIGDWVVLTTETGEHTVEIIDISYFRSGHPMYITSEGRWFGNDTKARLWNINYVKDGDILCYDDEVFIYKNFDNSIGYYACWDGKNIHINSFYLLTFEEMKTIKPATKEQRKELLRHLSNAGYVFDITNKEILPKND